MWGSGGIFGGSIVRTAVTTGDQGNVANPL